MSELNDPRVLFAAERTLLAWNRTSLAMIAFGFVVDRAGLLLQMLGQPQHGREALFAFWAGLAFVVLGILSAGAAVLQHKTVVKELRPVEIPAGYRVNLGAYLTLAVGVLGGLMALYLIIRGPLF